MIIKVTILILIIGANLQVLDVCKRIQWSREVNRVFDKASDTQAKPDLQRVFQRIINTLDALTDAVRQNQSGGRTVTPLNQARMSYLTATLLELRDTTQTLVQDNPTSRFVCLHVAIYWIYKYIKYI